MKRVVGGLIRALLLALAIVINSTGAAGASTTELTTDSYTYDEHPDVGRDAPALNVIDRASSRVTGSWERFASSAADGRATSTISSPSVVATNSADDVLRLGTKDSWGNLTTLDDHFARHGADFGAASADDYARQASEFLQQPGTLTKIDPKTGVIRVYDPATEAFGAYNPTGTTRTFYIPDPAKHGYPTNLDYWNAQPG